MDKYISIELLKYCDCFGTKFNFYSERNRKFYTPLGGVLSILSIIVGFLVFIFINRDEFSHNKPISTTSTSKVLNTKIKFLEEKIWIPWLIRDYNSRTLNFTNLLYPIAFYYRGVYNETRKALDLSYSIINYRLCNEASMANYTDLFTLDIALDKIYCIDMNDLEMGEIGILIMYFICNLIYILVKTGLIMMKKILIALPMKKLLKQLEKIILFHLIYFIPLYIISQW